MADVFEAEDVEEAIALAEEARRDGKYDLFRGQARGWPVVPTFLRLSAAEQERALEKDARYRQWLHGTPGLEQLAAKEDEAMAVAQHYGLSTTFVDFTTEPRIAAFFATETAEPGEEEPRCILCLNAADLKETCEPMRLLGHRSPPAVLPLSVPDLWRLEAQHGVFLHCPLSTLEEDVYDLDRIVFPAAGPVARPTLDEVYPRPSHLETLLDHFFMTERLFQGDARARERLRLWSVLECEAPETGCDPAYVRGGDVPVHPSWEEGRLAPWLAPTPERYEGAVGGETCVLAVEPTTPVSERFSRLVARVLSRLRADSTMRRRLVPWRVQSVPGTGSRLTPEQLNPSLDRLWDGLRVLPCTDEDIAAAIANCILLALHGAGIDPGCSERWFEVARECYGPSLYIQFGVGDGSYSPGFVTTRGLLGAVRDDIGEFIVPAHRDAVLKNPGKLLRAVSSPGKLFDFDRLARAFVREVVPGQVLLGRVALFSPARLESMELIA